MFKIYFSAKAPKIQERSELNLNILLTKRAYF